MKVKLILTNVGNNNNKFWYGEAHSDGTYHAHWGRVGAKGQEQTKSFGSQYAAESYLRKKQSEKEAKGYREVAVVENGAEVSPKSVEASKLSDIAKSQIKTNDSLVTKLIEYFTTVNAHQITKATGGKVTYNADTGLFQTPLGIVTQDGIDKANSVLSRIGSLVAASDFGYDMERLTNDYLMLIPHDYGMRRISPSTIFGTLAKVQKEQSIVDSLQASLLQVQTQPKPVQDKTDNEPMEKVFDVQLDVVTDPAIIQRIVKFYEGSKNSQHTSYNLKVKKVYAVIIKGEREAFEKKGKAIGNVMELWHGTRASNVLSILKQGLVIPPAHSSHCTGRMYGNGLYFSDQSTKSLNYSQGYWSGGARDNNCFMFLADVAMGKWYTPSSGWSRTSLPAGYDSTFAKAGQSGVRNNEMIVYRLFQASLKFLVEFSN